MTALHPLLQPEIPKSAKVFGWVLVFAGCFFAYIYMFKPDAFFAGVSVTSYSEKFGLYSTGVRILGSVLGIALALYFNSAILLCLMLSTRIFIELGDVVVGLILNQGVPDSNTLTLLILAAVEIYFARLLWQHIKSSPTA